MKAPVEGFYPKCTCSPTDQARLCSRYPRSPAEGQRETLYVEGIE
jgi:hypothetical protein